MRSRREINTRINDDLSSAHFTLNDIIERLCNNNAKKFLQYLSVPSYMLKTDRSSEYKKSLNDSNDYIKQIQYIIEQTLHYYSTTYGHLTKQKYNYDDFVHIILYLTEKTFTEYEIKDEIDAERLLKYMNLYHFENGWFDYDKYDRFKNDFHEQLQNERALSSRLSPDVLPPPPSSDLASVDDSLAMET